jgi:protein phosphatase
MTLVLRYAVRSDVGLLREGNEDSAYAGPRLLAVADGMGGHAAGEVASSVTIASMAELGTEAMVTEQPGGDMLAELASAVAAANTRLQEMIIANPAVEGMGTTLTALFWSDGHAAVCHIGDSRGYLLREHELYQITHDHTLVQSLVDEGRISADDVSTHPQRSLLLRALDGRSVAEPDLSVHEGQPGDRYLLCSDGLSGVVSDETLRETLATIADPEAVTRQLIDLALHGGGPDNITCIVADVVDSGTTRLPASDLPRPQGRGFPGHPRLLVSGPGAPGGSAGGDQHTYELVTPVTLLGRGTDCDLRLVDPGVSRHHAELRVESDQVVLVDLSSTNGTFVNGQPVRRVALSDGTQVSLGRTTLVFRQDRQDGQGSGYSGSSY